MKGLLQLVGLTAVLALILTAALLVAGHVDLHRAPPGLGPESPDPRPVIIVTIQPEVTR